MRVAASLVVLTFPNATDHDTGLLACIHWTAVDRASLIAGLEYGMEQWNGKWNGKVNIHSCS